MFPHKKTRSEKLKRLKDSRKISSNHRLVGDYHWKGTNHSLKICKSNKHSIEILEKVCLFAYVGM